SRSRWNETRPLERFHVFNLFDGKTLGIYRTRPKRYALPWPQQHFRWNNLQRLRRSMCRHFFVLRPSSFVISRQVLPFFAKAVEMPRRLYINFPVIRRGGSETPTIQRRLA